MLQTIVDWGPLRLWNVQTQQFSQEQIFDSTDTNVTHSKFTIVVSGLIRSWPTGATPGGVYSGELTDLTEIDPTPVNHVPSSITYNATIWRDYVGISARFAYRVGCNTDGSSGQLFLYAQPYSDNGTHELWEDVDGFKCWYDCQSGPKLKSISINNMYCGAVAHVTMTFEVCVPWCESYDGLNDKLLENTWTVADTIDENLYTTRVYRGRIKTANPYVNPNLLRAVAIPPLADGMRRQSMSFEVEADGRTLAYSITDKEATFSAPYPATTWKVQVTESMSIGRPLLHTTLSIQMAGDRNTAKKALMSLAVAVAEERVIGLNIANNANNKTLIIEDITMMEYISQDDPISVELRVSVRHIRTDGNDNKLNGKGGAFGKDLLGTNWPYQHDNDPDPDNPGPGYQSNISADPGVEGLIPLESALRNRIRGICSAQPAIRDGDYSDPANRLADVDYPDPAILPELEVRNVANGSTSKPAWVSGQFSTAIYTHYQIDSVYDITDNREQLAIAGLATAYTDGDPTCSTVTMGLPTATRLIRIEATRHGDAPKLQEPKDTWTVGTMTFTRLKTKMAPTSPERSPTGQNLWTVRAEYLYACSRPPKNNEAIAVGLDPTWVGSAPNLPSGTFSDFEETSSMSS